MNFLPFIKPIQEAFNFVGRIYDNQSIIAFAKETIGLREEVTATSRPSHSLYGEAIIHPDNHQSLIALPSRQLEFLAARPPSLHESLVLVGAPNLEKISRLVFGYEARDKISMARVNPPVDFPYFWILMRTKLARRFVVLYLNSEQSGVRIGV